jgi:DNA-binding beta-propeller fold protein YncE
VHGDEVYVTDFDNSRVEVFDRGGTFLRTWGFLGTGDGQFKMPAGVAVQGNEVFVADRNNNRVQVFCR